MISQRDVLQFFNLVEVLGNPDKYKAALDSIANAQADIVEKTNLLQAREQNLAAREQEAANIIQTREGLQKSLDERIARCDAFLVELAQRKDVMDRREAEIDAKGVRFNELSVQLEQKDAELNKRQEEIDVKTIELAERQKELNEQIDEYNLKIEQLKGILK